MKHTTEAGAGPPATAPRDRSLTRPLARPRATGFGGASDIALVLAISAALVAWTLMKSSEHQLNADTPILTVMSLQKVTLFFWGQNRFLNLVPALASPITSADLNLKLQLFIFGVGMVGLLAMIGAFISRTIGGSEQRIDAWLAFLTLLAAFVAMSTDNGLYVFFSHGLPYGLSWMLMLGGFALVMRQDAAGLPVWAIAIVLIVLGAGLNPSLLIAVGPLLLLSLLLWPERARRSAIAAMLAVAACGLWLRIQRAYPGGLVDYGTFAVADPAADLKAALAGLEEGVSPRVLAALAAAGLAAAVLLWSRQALGKRATALALGAILFGAGWLVLFAQHEWVKANHAHFRYFFPTLLALVAAISLPLVLAVMKAPLRAKHAAIAVMLAAIAWRCYEPLKSIDDLGPMRRDRAAIAEAMDNNLTFVAGDYWRVWPAVYALAWRGKTAYGLETHRGIANKARAMRHAVHLRQQGIRPQSLCLGATAHTCISQAQEMLGSRWRQEDSNAQCGSDCTVIVEY